MPPSIGARLALLVALVLVPLLVLLEEVYRDLAATHFEQALHTELEVAQGVATTFAAYIEDVRRETYTVGQAIVALAAPGDGRITRLLALTEAQYPTVRPLLWVGADGSVRASSLPAQVGLDLADRDYFRRIAGGAPWAVSELVERGRGTDTPVFTIASAARDRGGDLRGVVVAVIEPDRLGELTLTQRRPSRGAYAIFDPRGRLVYRNPAPSTTWGVRTLWAHTDPILAAARRTGRSRTGVAVLPGDAERWLTARVPIGGLGWWAGAARPLDVALAPMQRQMRQDIAIAVGVAALALLAALLVGRSISRPLRRLEADAVHRFADGRESADDDPAAPLEVRSLRTAMARLAADLSRRNGALRASERRFRELADAMPQLVWTAEADGTIDYYNDRYRLYAGIERSAEGNYVWAPVLHEADVQPTVDAWQRALASGDVYEAEHRVRLRDDGFRWHLSRAFPVRDDTGRVAKWFGTATDIHELKTAGVERDRLLAELERSNRELEQFAYIASHDLQEPLRMVASYVQLLARRYRGQLDAKADTYIHFAVDGAERMQRLIEGLLAYSRVNRRGGAFQTLESGRVLRAALANLALALRESNAEVSHDPLPAVLGDELQLVQLFQNLIGNALKYHRPGRPPRVHVAAVRDGGLWHFTVRDNGIGIEARHFEDIFQLFQRLHPREEYPGTGIGLALCRRIVERHHGRIWVESTPAVGTTFHFTLPPAADGPPEEARRG